MLGQRIGYIRVSTFEQNPDRQLDTITLDRTFTEKASGKDARRPLLAALLSFARAGDTVIVHSMDRLARNLDDLRRIVQTLAERGVCVEFIKEHLTFTGEDTPMATLMLSVMGPLPSSSGHSYASASAKGLPWPKSAVSTAAGTKPSQLRR